MGKYMRHKGRVEKKAAIDGAMGVRTTRARALAMDGSPKQLISRSSVSTGESLQQLNDGNCAMECNRDELITLFSSEYTEKETYMELRSRRLQKPVISEKDVTLKSGDHPSLRIHAEQHSLRGAMSDCSRQTSLQSPAITLTRKRIPTLSARSAVCASSRKRFASSPTDVSVQTSAAQASLPSSASKELSVTNSESISSRRHIGMLTRHQKQLLARLTVASDVDADNAGPEEQFYGENQLAAGSDRPQRSCFREATPDASYNQGVEAPGSSTSRTRQQRMSLDRVRPYVAGQAPSHSEIESFFRGPERQVRRRFIDRYNFDPANERPLRGRYQWTSL